MKMKAVDQLHISALGADTMPAGTEFEVSASLAADLEKKGLAVRVTEEASDQMSDEPKPEAGKTEAAKAEEAPANKAEQPPANKATKPSRKKKG
ncbi:MAG: hypothetical protein AB7P12_15250 [Alphaproteobacteria bacterium]